jgi:hypothetical protein
MEKMDHKEEAEEGGQKKSFEVKLIRAEGVQ